MLYDSIYMRCPELTTQATNSRLEVARDQAAEEIWGVGGIGSDGQCIRALFLGWWKCSGFVKWWWLYKLVNIIKAAEFFTLKKWSLWYVNISIKIKSKFSPTLDTQSHSSKTNTANNFFISFQKFLRHITSIKICVIYPFPFFKHTRQHFTPPASFHRHPLEVIQDQHMQVCFVHFKDAFRGMDESVHY